jgi:uncharacterized membrane protein
MIWLKIIWLLIGLIGWFVTYHSMRKDWYITYHKEYWKSKYKSGLILLCILSPILICSGPIIFLLTLLSSNGKLSFYFNIKRYEKKLLNKKHII